MIRIDFQEGIYTGKRKETKIDFKDLSPVLQLLDPYSLNPFSIMEGRRIY
jgi:hypothetical protein